MHKTMYIMTILFSSSVYADSGLVLMPTAYEEMQQRQQAKRPVQRRQASYVSQAAYPPSTGGKCVKNELGTEWPGINGYHSPEEKGECE